MIHYDANNPNGKGREPQEKLPLTRSTFSDDSVLFVGPDLAPVKSWASAAAEGKKTRDSLRARSSRERL